MMIEIDALGNDWLDDWNHEAGVEYFKRKMHSALKVPPGYFKLVGELQKGPKLPEAV